MRDLECRGRFPAEQPRPAFRQPLSVRSHGTPGSPRPAPDRHRRRVDGLCGGMAGSSAQRFEAGRSDPVRYARPRQTVHRSSRSSFAARSSRSSGSARPFGVLVDRGLRAPTGRAAQRANESGRASGRRIDRWPPGDGRPGPPPGPEPAQPDEEPPGPCATATRSTPTAIRLGSTTRTGRTATTSPSSSSRVDPPVDGRDPVRGPRPLERTLPDGRPTARTSSRCRAPARSQTEASARATAPGRHSDTGRHGPGRETRRPRGRPPPGRRCRGRCPRRAVGSAGRRGRRPRRRRHSSRAPIGRHSMGRTRR